MLTTRNISFSYNGERNFRFPDIELLNGQELLILGESGIGKTTLLHIIAGLLPPTHGSIELEGKKLYQLSTKQLDKFRGQNIGIVFQHAHFINSLTVGENLQLIQHLAGNRQDTSVIKRVLNSLDIANKFNSKPFQLSQGEQQRASIALAIINNPNLILADEPTSSLDDKNCTKVVDLLRKQASLTQAKLIIITHDNRLKHQFKNRLIL